MYHLDSICIDCSRRLGCFKMSPGCLLNRAFWVTVRSCDDFLPKEVK